MGTPNDRMHDAIKAILEDFPELDKKTVELHTLMQSLFKIILNLCDDCLSDFEINRARLKPLVYLFASEAKIMKSSDLAVLTGVSRAAMTGVLDSLEKAQLIVRSEVDDDRRVVNIALTPKGLRLVRRVMPIYFAQIGQIFNRITGEEKATLEKILKKIS